MNILYFHQHFSTPSGSTGIRSYQMARRLIARGHDVTMVCGSYDQGRTGLSGPFHRGVRQGDVDGIHVIEFELGYSNQLGLLSRTRQFLRYAWRSVAIAWRHQADIVVATSTPLTAAIPGIGARLARRPFVFEVRDLWPELPKAMGVIRNPLLIAMLRCLEWTGYRSANRLIGLAPGIVDGIRAGGGDGKPVAMIPNGCDIDLFAPEKPRTSARRFDADRPLTAIFTGTHGVANGLDAVLDAAVLLANERDRSIRFILIGDGKQKAALQQRAQREGLTNVEFKSPVGKVKLARIMSEADVGLQVLADVPAFYRGTSPNKFFDYISAQLPVLTNYPGWIAELIVEQRCGRAVPSRDPLAFARALQEMAANPDELIEMGLRGAKLARSQFDRRDLADQWVDFVTHKS